jgi:cellulose synthase (UDP-forming)
MTKTIDRDRRARAAGIALLLTTAWFVPWLVVHVDTSRLWLSIPFLAATFLVAAAALVSVVNRWQRAIPERRSIPAGREPEVAVIIPTCGEPLQLLEGTIRSVLDQDWPVERLWLLVSDDGADDRVSDLVNRLALEFPKASLRYHRPPPQGSPERHGEAKAGNLNSALRLLPDRIEFVETRDADDLVGDRHFLRETVGQLVAGPRLAFVQTAKAGQVSSHDPFDNQQPHFFQCAMLSRYAANAVFPCGSGVVWRREALHEIGDFPIWNLVEDLQSGVEALRRGWDGCYLPILGAFAQHSPEDLPNFVKQRGTWALDTMRLTLWAPKHGLSLRQRLQFYELGLFYMQGPATIMFLLAPILGFLFHDYPVVTSTSDFVRHFWPFVAALELHLALIHRPMSLEQLWRARLVWAGLCFVYARACVLAILGGRTSKPRYVVTRKENRYAWHWRLIVPHALVLALLVGSMAWSLSHHSVLSSFDIGSAYWAALYSLLLIGFVRLSWHGVSSGSALRQLGPRRRRGLPAGGPAAVLEGGQHHGAEPAVAAAPAPVALAPRPAVWASAGSGPAQAALMPMPGDHRGPQSREALRQLELRIGEWGRHGEVHHAGQLSPEAAGPVSSVAAES